MVKSTAKKGGKKPIKRVRKPAAKRKRKVAAAAPRSTPKPTAPAGGATYFEDVTWGMTPAEIAARYPIELRSNGRFGDVRRELGGVPVRVSFRFGDGGLFAIDVAGVRRYAEWGEGDNDELRIVDWISSRAGRYTSRDPASVTWHLPTAKIWTYVDESLGLYFGAPEPAAPGRGPWRPRARAGS